MSNIIYVNLSLDTNQSIQEVILKIKQIGFIYNIYYLRNSTTYDLIVDFFKCGESINHLTRVIEFILINHSIQYKYSKPKNNLVLRHENYNFR